MQMVGFGAEYMLTSAVALIVGHFFVCFLFKREKKVNEAM